MRGRFIVVLALLMSLSSGLGVLKARAAGDGVVHALLFYSPSCPHCHTVMTEVLPPLQEQYGEQLQVLTVDTTTPQGQSLWRATVASYDVARGNPPSTGVPTLIIGAHSLVGSMEIPAVLPSLVEEYLNGGGVGWPSIPGLDQLVDDEPASVVPPSSWETLRARYTRDLAGNILSTLVLVALVAGLVAVMRPRDWQLTLAQRVGPLGTLVVILIGSAAAVYLSYIETTGQTAVCGPVGDCNAVQQSAYATLFGVLPVAVLGVLGYIAILCGFVYVTWIRGAMTEAVAGLLFLMTLFGLTFSIYLTFLEPFVIGATCAWCLTSAVCMLGVALLSAGRGWRGLRRIGYELGLMEGARSH